MYHLNRPAWAQGSPFAVCSNGVCRPGHPGCDGACRRPLSPDDSAGVATEAMQGTLCGAVALGAFYDGRRPTSAGVLTQQLFCGLVRLAACLTRVVQEVMPWALDLCILTRVQNAPTIVCWFSSQRAGGWDIFACSWKGPSPRWPARVLPLVYLPCPALRGESCFTSIIGVARLYLTRCVFS